MIGDIENPTPEDMVILKEGADRIIEVIPMSSTTKIVEVGQDVSYQAMILNDVGAHPFIMEQLCRILDALEAEMVARGYPSISDFVQSKRDGTFNQNNYIIRDDDIDNP